MTASNVTGPMPTLVGRDSERAAIEDALQRAAGGDSASIVVRGEAGIGKSTLLEYAAARAQGMTVLRTTGVGAESDLAFAGLYGLLRPALGTIDELPDIQAEALRGALGLARSSESDRFLVSAAVLGLLAAAAEESPVLALVDDAQWLDAPSADALVFTARRLRADRVAILFGAREGDPHRFEAPGLPEIVLDGLDRQAGEAILTGAGTAPAPAVRERLLAEAAGNPLALIELPGALSAEQLAGAESLPEAIPLTPRLQRVFRQQTARLPVPTQEAMLIAAADDTGAVATVMRAAAELGLPPDALDPAEACGLLRTTGATIEFRHPLVRSTLHDGATLSERCRAHTALAAALPGEENADRRVWHQAMATLTRDEAVAGELEASARRAQLRAAHGSAATAFLRAAELSADEDRRTDRLVAAARAAWDAGQPERANTAIEQALPAASGELKAELLRLRGMIGARSGRLLAARSAFLESFEETRDPSLRLELLYEAGEVSSYAGDLAAVGDLGRRAEGLVPVTQRDHLNRSVLMAFASLFAGDVDTARATFADALSRADELDEPSALVRASSAASVRGAWGAGLPYATRAVELARRRGSLSELPRALERLAGELLWNSNFDLALAAAEEGYRLSTDMGFLAPWHLMTMAVVAAVWGREEDAKSHVDEVLEIGRSTDAPFLITSAEFTLAFTDLVASRWQDATDRLLRVADNAAANAHPVTWRAAVPDLVEAAVRAGRVAEIAHCWVEYKAWARSTPDDLAGALVARSEAMLGERPGDAGFAEAIDLEGGLPPFQRARTRLMYGEWLRRERRRQDARAQLRAALETFEQLGAVPFEARAAAELRATGETARKRDPSTRDQLTAQEIQIAGLVAEGLANREIAAQLYLSPRTIDYHLRKVFLKLGISSRRELVRDGLPER